MRYMVENEIICGDCLEVMKDWPDGCADMILADVPYGTTACKWDTIIPLEPMWKQLKRIIKPNGAIVMTASQPFTTTLIASNMKMFKYCWVWEHNRCPNFAQAPYMPLRSTEDVVVFSFGGCAHPAKNRMIYNPQGVEEGGKVCKNGSHPNYKHRGGLPTAKTFIQRGSNYPKQIINIPKEGKTVHPTQKPVALMEYLIKTYTNEGELVLDFTCGSGTTCKAAQNLGRRFIVIEISPDYCQIARDRLRAVDTGVPVKEARAGQGALFE